MPDESTAGLRFLHLTGSAVDQLLDDVSRLYAHSCLDAIGDAGEHHVAHVSPDGAWRFPERLADLEAAEPLTFSEAVARIEQLTPDVALPQMFCLPGMTTYRALLDLLGVPWVGNRPETMAIAADKPLASAIVAAAGVAVPASRVLVRGADPSEVDLRLPAVVKPADSDNSLGVALVRDAADLPAALADAWQHSERALVEEYVPLGREVRCAVLERPDGLLALPLEEYAVDESTKPVRDHADKLRRSDAGNLGLVAKDAEHAWVVPTDDPVTAAVHPAALIAYQALGCRDHGLFDFRVSPDGTPYFLEASLYCSFAPSSVVVTLAAAAGITLPDLLAEQVELARSRS